MIVQMLDRRLNKGAPAPRGAGTIVAMTSPVQLAVQAEDLIRAEGDEVRDGTPALRFACRHRYATGYVVQQGDRRWAVDPADPVWRLPKTAGSHTATVSVRTAHGELAAQQLVFRVTG